MFGVMKMFGGVFVLGRIAATHVAALRAHAQVDPCVAGFDALFADVRVSADVFDLCEMSACSRHENLLRLRL